MTTFTVSTAAQLSSALQAAQGGDVIRMAGGDYGNFYISSKLYASDVTITSADPGNPAVFDTLSIKASSNINIVGVNVDFTPTMTTQSFSSAVSIDKSSGITFSDGVIKGGPAVNGVPASALDLDSTGNVIGMPTARGITIQGSSDVTIEDSDISQFLRGIVVGASDGVKILDNEIHHLRKSAIVGNSDNLLIEGNHLHSSNPWRIGEPNGDHADFIALWTDSKQTAPTSNITIRDNLMEQGDGARILGLWLQGGEDGYRNVIIEGNAILGGDHQGIMMSNTVGGVVANNVLLQTTAYEKAPGIILLEGASGFSVTGNIAWSISDKNAGSTGNVIGANSLVQNLDASKAGYYDASLVSTVLGLDSVSEIYAATQLDIGSIGGIISAPSLTLPPLTSPITVAPVPAPVPAPAPAPAPIATGDQTLSGNGGANTLSGGDQNDLLDGRGGADRLVGGAGNDTYILPNNQATVVESAGQGIDTVIAKGDYTLGANVENLVINNTVDNNWSGVGNALNNEITGNAGRNTLDGGAGNDTLDGGAGNDILIGGAGADRLIGGAGADTFRFAKGSGQDTVVDFGAGDTLDVSALLKVAKVTVTDVGADTLLKFSTGETITLMGVDPSHLKAASAGFVYG